MRIIAINGSPRGKASNTNVMVTSFLKGAQEAGADTLNVLLAEKSINFCRGCFACWFITPGKCVIDDDMAEILSVSRGADVLVLATPQYSENISGTLKTFMDRSVIVMSDPHFQKDITGECRHFKRVDIHSPKIVMMANCGFPGRAHFEVISHWIKRLSLKMCTEVIGEIYATQGDLLTNSQGEFQSVIASYKNMLGVAGKEIVTYGKLTDETAKLLERQFISDESYIVHCNRNFDSIINNSHK